MLKHPLLIAFDRINEKLSNQDIYLLKIITGNSDENKLLEIFFQDLTDYKALYKFPIWDKIKTEEKKQMIKLDILYWYRVITSINPDFKNLCNYNSEDDLKLQIKVSGLNLKDENERKNYLNYLSTKYLDALDENASTGYINWIKALIETTKDNLNTKTSDKRKGDLSFPELFFDQEMAIQVDMLLEDSDYIKQGVWIATDIKKKIATPFYVLRDDEPGICIIKRDKVTPQLRTWCNHYGVTVNENEIRSFLMRPKYDPHQKPDYIEFVDLFTKLKKAK